MRHVLRQNAICHCFFLLVVSLITYPYAVVVHTRTALSREVQATHDFIMTSTFNSDSKFNRKILTSLIEIGTGVV